MTLTVKFDGHDITQYLRVSSLNRGVRTSRNSRTETRKGKKGVIFLGTESFLSKIEMGFVLRHDLIEKRRKLAEILNVNEPKPLEFSDEPGKYYLAFPTGDIKVDEN